jgi:iron complex outermembrane receptor protein
MSCRLHGCPVAGPAFVVFWLLCAHANGFAQTVEDLSRLPIEDLAAIKVSSVAKTPQLLSDAPAAIYVISHDDIAQSGATTLPEMLRLAPNLEVVQLNANSYAISARGFNVGDNASLSNKLLVLIDGRSVYTPLFGGVYWDMLQILPEDIERIEVISGPGATLWGANAVNGVINIITRPSRQTQGGMLTAGGGNTEQMASLQYGAELSPDLSFRINAAGYNFASLRTSDGQKAEDGLTKPAGGFRIDWTPGSDTVTAEGDLFAAEEGETGYLTGRDFSLSWQHPFDDGGKLQLLAYYDREARYQNGGGPGFSVSTYDVEAQYNRPLGSWNELVVGAGDRLTGYDFENSDLALTPASARLNLGEAFAQDTISLTGALKLTLGMKLEADPYATIQPMPSIRLAWKPAPPVLLWGAVSRAVRAPTPVDTVFHELAGQIDLLNGNPSFRPEKMVAFEAGTRVELNPRASFSVSLFDDVYTDLRSLEETLPGFFPLYFANRALGHVYGLESWADYRVTDWWHLAAGFNMQHEALKYVDQEAVGGLDFLADDPNHQASLRSTVTFGGGVAWEADVRFVGALPHPAVPAYAEMNTRLAWQATHRLEVSLSGFNLLHPQHIEFFEQGVTDEIPRSFFLQAKWGF